MEEKKVTLIDTETTGVRAFDGDKLLYDDSEKLRVVLVEPEKKPRIIEIDHTLEDMQKLVGGLIEPIYNDDDTVLICNEEGKMSGLPLNRAIYSNGKMVDIVAGNFFVAYAPPDAEDFQSLSDDMTEKYMKRFEKPETFWRRIDGKIMAMPYDNECTLDDSINNGKGR